MENDGAFEPLGELPFRFMGRRGGLLVRRRAPVGTTLGPRQNRPKSPNEGRTSLKEDIQLQEGVSRIVPLVQYWPAQSDQGTDRSVSARSFCGYAAIRVAIKTQRAAMSWKSASAKVVIAHDGKQLISATLPLFEF